MMINWSTCQCCGQPATQRQISVTKYHPTMDGVQGQLYTADKPVRMLPDLCDKCCNDIASHHPTANDFWAEYEQRSQEFRKNFDIVGFVGFIPIIEAKPAALSYCI